MPFLIPKEYYVLYMMSSFFGDHPRNRVQPGYDIGLGRHVSSFHFNIVSPILLIQVFIAETRFSVVTRHYNRFDWNCPANCAIMSNLSGKTIHKLYY
jgi:hypothetical protein